MNAATALAEAGTCAALRSAGLHASHAGPDDVRGLVALVQSAYRGEDSRAGWTTEADLLDGQRLDEAMARELLAESAGVVLLFRGTGQGVGDAEAAGALRACVQLTDRGAGVVGFGMFAVAPQLQGAGVGSAVMDAACAYARTRWDAQRMRMTVISRRTELIDYYRRLGFEPTGESEPFPYGQEQFGIPRRDDLEFAVLERPLV